MGLSFVNRAGRHVLRLLNAPTLTGLALGDIFMQTTATLARPTLRFTAALDRRISIHKGDVASMTMLPVDIGTCTFNEIGIEPVWSYPDSVDSYSTWRFLVDERYVNEGVGYFKYRWFIDQLQTGGVVKNCVWQIEYNSSIAGNVISNTAAEVTQAVKPVALAINEAARTVHETLSASVAASHLNNTHLLTARIWRRGTHASDTMVGDAHIQSSRGLVQT